MNDVGHDHSPVAVPPADTGQITGERHVSEVAGPAPILTRKVGIAVLVTVTVIAVVLILLAAEKPELKVGLDQGVVARSIVKFEPAPQVPVVVAPQPLPLPPPPPATPIQPAVVATQSSAPKAPSPPRLLVYSSDANTSAAASRMGAASLAGVPGPGAASSFGNGAADSAQGQEPGIALTAGPASGSVSGSASGSASGSTSSEDLRSRLTPTRLTGVSAAMLRNQPYLLTLGTLVPCILQTAMDSTLPGFVTCVIPQDVQGKTGLTLFDRGTRVVGEFRGGIRQGVERMFVVWTRAETPQGVVINLDSPATDPLGRSGMEGDVERHFWQRFGGALLLSAVDGAIQAGVASASKQGTTTINTGQAEAVITEILRGSINIPPTIRKNQGELVSIFVARDLDFSTVYRVQPVPAPAPAPVSAPVPTPVPTSHADSEVGSIP